MAGELTDYQILTLIRDHPGATIYQLLDYARAEMPVKPDKPDKGWTRGKVHKSVQRLKGKKRIKGRIKLNGARACQQLYLV
jgi:hypothetical protein